jgi:hypothetical protein
MFIRAEALAGRNLNMNTIEFVKHLRATAEALTPLAESVTAGALRWNGEKYASQQQQKVPQSYALAWQSTLNAVAEMIDRQDAPLSEKQLAYLDRLLFGGMGSLNDLQFDEKVGGDIAKIVNDSLDKQRRALHASFKTN